MKNKVTLRARFKSGRWEIVHGYSTYTIDAGLMYVSSRGKDWVEGVLVQSYGLDQQLADTLDKSLLRVLGVGGPRNTHRPIGSEFVGRAQLTQDGKVVFEK